VEQRQPRARGGSAARFESSRAAAAALRLVVRQPHLDAAAVEAGRRRLRPILMTTATTVLGLVPMSLGIGEGSELQVPMARVVIGGLLTSTLITLVFIPVIYATLEELSERRREPALATEGPEPQPMSGD